MGLAQADDLHDGPWESGAHLGPGDGGDGDFEGLLRFGQAPTSGLHLLGNEFADSGLDPRLPRLPGGGQRPLRRLYPGVLLSAPLGALRLDDLSATGLSPCLELTESSPGHGRFVMEPLVALDLAPGFIQRHLSLRHRGLRRGPCGPGRVESRSGRGVGVGQGPGPMRFTLGLFDPQAGLPQEGLRLFSLTPGAAGRQVSELQPVA